MNLNEGSLAAAEAACRTKLREEPFATTLGRLGPLAQPERAFEFLSHITVRPDSSAELVRVRGAATSGENEVERTLLLLASQHALTKVSGLPVSDSVKKLLADEFLFFANPPEAWIDRFEATHVRYQEMARVATLRRFPAGQFHWELAAVPRSSLRKTSQPVKMLAHVILKMGGFAPVVEFHLNERRKNRLILLEKEANLSYFRVARSLERQPHIRALMLGSWMFCKSTAIVSPHLAWLRRTPEEGGALIAGLGPAEADAGFLTGSQERRKMYDEGTYRPQLTCVLWPRKQLIAWANRHPEFDL